MKKILLMAMAALAAGTFCLSATADEVEGGQTPSEAVTIDTHTALDALIGGYGPIFYEGGTSVTNIRNYAFAECRQITSIRADYAQTIGVAAFRGCVSLREVKLPLAVSITPTGAMFAGCISLENVYLDALDLAAAKAAGFPWQAPARAVVFHFKDGDYDKNGRKL